MTLGLEILSWVCLLAGAAFAVIGGIGLLRLPDLFARMHAAGITDTLAMALILIGLMFQAGLGLNLIKLVLILALILFTSPTATHAVAKAALHGGEKPAVAPADPQVTDQAALEAPGADTPMAQSGLDQIPSDKEGSPSKT